MCTRSTICLEYVDPVLSKRKEEDTESHIESVQCGSLPKKNYLTVGRHGRSMLGKLKIIRASNVFSKFISTAQSVVDPSILLNKDVSGKYDYCDT